MTALSILAVCCLSSCSEEEPASTPSGPPEPPVTGVSLQGCIWTIKGDTIDTGDCSTALLYHWIPIPDYTAGETDLTALDSLARLGMRVIPVQFDSISRHIAQYQVQESGSELAVLLADAGITRLCHDSSRTLPVSILACGESLSYARGHGSPFRVLRSCPLFDADSMLAASAPEPDNGSPPDTLDEALLPQ